MQDNLQLIVEVSGAQKCKDWVVCEHYVCSGIDDLIRPSHLAT